MIDPVGLNTLLFNLAIAFVFVLTWAFTFFYFLKKCIIVPFTEEREYPLKETVFFVLLWITLLMGVGYIVSYRSFDEHNNLKQRKTKQEDAPKIIPVPQKSIEDRSKEAFEKNKKDNRNNVKKFEEEVPSINKEKK